MVFIGGLMIGLFILSHNISAYMFMPWLAILGVLLLFGTGKYWRLQIGYLGIMFGLGLLASSYFWIPALFESRLMKYDTVFNFIDHFPTIKQLMTPYWGYGASVAGPYDGMSFFLGFSNILVLVVGLLLVVIYVLYAKNKRIHF